MLNLPIPSKTYDPQAETRRNEMLKQADIDNYKRTRHLAIPLERRLMLQSPDGNWWAISISNAGNITADSGLEPGPWS